jgi:hypothetical protein
MSSGQLIPAPGCHRADGAITHGVTSASYTVPRKNVQNHQAITKRIPIKIKNP